jgi:hypothetical protein
MFTSPRDMIQTSKRTTSARLGSAGLQNLNRGHSRSRLRRRFALVAGRQARLSARLGKSTPRLASRFHSFRTLLADLATLTCNIVRSGTAPFRRAAK